MTLRSSFGISFKPNNYLEVTAADLKQKLFLQSPIGKGLIGKNKNDLVEINTPAGVKNFEIKDVKYL